MSEGQTQEVGQEGGDWEVAASRSQRRRQQQPEQGQARTTNNNRNRRKRQNKGQGQGQGGQNTAGAPRNEKAPQSPKPGQAAPRSPQPNNQSQQGGSEHQNQGGRPQGGGRGRGRGRGSQGRGGRDEDQGGQDQARGGRGRGNRQGRGQGPRDEQGQGGQQGQGPRRQGGRGRGAQGQARREGDRTQGERGPKSQGPRRGSQGGPREKAPLELASDKFMAYCSLLDFPLRRHLSERDATPNPFKMDDLLQAAALKGEAKVTDTLRTAEVVHLKPNTKNIVDFRYRVHLALSASTPTVVVSHQDSTMVFTTTVVPEKKEEKKDAEEQKKEAAQPEEAKKEEPKKEEPKKEEVKKDEKGKKKEAPAEQPKKEETPKQAPGSPAQGEASQEPVNEVVKISQTESKRLGYNYYYNYTESVGVYYLTIGYSSIQPQLLIKTAAEWSAGEVQFLLETFAQSHAPKDFDETLTKNGYTLRSRVFYSNPAAIVCERLGGKDAEPDLEEYEKRVVKRTGNFLIPTKVEIGKQRRTGLEEGISFLRVGKFFSFKGKDVKEERVCYGCDSLPCHHSQNISVFWNRLVEPAVENV